MISRASHRCATRTAYFRLTRTHMLRALQHTLSGFKMLSLRSCISGTSTMVNATVGYDR
jgi:hypothetical protein